MSRNACIAKVVAKEGAGWIDVGPEVQQSAASAEFTTSMESGSGGNITSSSSSPLERGQTSCRRASGLRNELNVEDGG